MKLRVGLIGQNDSWQTRHGPALRVLHDRFDVRAVFNSVSKLTENIAGEFQADVIDGYRALVSRCDIDAVIVMQNTWLGWLPILAACEAGKAVYWAGELDVYTQTDQHVRDAIEQSGISFMIELPRRFAPATLRLKELIATRLGKPQMIFCHRRLSKPSQSSRTQSARFSRCEMIELIDWCRYVVGRPASMVNSIAHPIDPSTAPQSIATENSRGGSHHTAAKNGAAGGRVIDHGRSDDGGSDRRADEPEISYRCLSLGFAGTENTPPVTAQLSCGSYIPAAWEEAIGFRSPAAMQVCCENGIAFIDLPSTLVWFDDAGRNQETLDTELPVGQQLMSRFHRGVTSLLRNVSDLDDIFSAAAILGAAEESEQQRHWVQLTK